MRESSAMHRSSRSRLTSCSMDWRARAARSMSGCRTAIASPRCRPVSPSSAATDSVPIAAMANEAERRYGVQFHPEVTHTKQGAEILRRFVVDVCGCQTLWTAGQHHRRRRRARARAGRQRQGAARAFRRRRFVGRRGAAREGNRRSADVRLRRHRSAALARRRSGHGDDGRAHGRQRDPRGRSGSLLRRARRASTIRKRSARSSAALFIEIFDEEAHKIEGVKWLAQGTIYPDVIESAGAKTGKAHVIKSHHNVGGLPEDMNLKLDRAVARIVQGRGAPHRRRTRPCRARWSIAIRSRGPVSACACSARSSASTSRFCRGR